MIEVKVEGSKTETSVMGNIIDILNEFPNAVAALAYTILLPCNTPEEIGAVVDMLIAAAADGVRAGERKHRREREQHED